MMVKVPFLSVHLDDIALQAGQHDMVEFLEQDGYAEMLEAVDGSYSVFKDGVLMGCGGLASQGNGRALAWTLITAMCEGTDMIAVTKIVRDAIVNSKYRRIEAIVRGDFEAGHKWMRLLGFKLETEHGMAGWFNDGEKGYLYSRSPK